MATEQLVDQDVLREAIRGEYEEVANHPTKGFHFHVGRFLADRLNYPEAWLAPLPEDAIESFAGVGNPFTFGKLKTGETVLDLGSGSGFDCLLAAQQVGPDGKVIGIDMTPAMNEKARANAAALGLTQVEFREGYLEALPINDDSIDVIISNGVINLCPDKTSVLAEAYRVLKPGGQLQVSDIIVQREVPESARKDIDLWTG
ncbi:hypothetical protein BH23CHL2_BH23CHL2_20860 [soil metagenome]